MVSIAKALQGIKHNPLDVLNRTCIERLCEEHGYEWRERELDPTTTIALFLQQIIHGNIPCTEVPLVARADFTGSAYCQARSRLPLEIYEALLRNAGQKARPAVDEAGHLWLGHRTWLVDGSTFSMPDTAELRQAFGLAHGPLPDCGFPVARLMVLFSASTGLLLEAVAVPGRTGELSQTPAMHESLSAGDLLVGDTLYSTYAHLALLLEGKKHGLFPMHQKRIVDFRPHRPFVKEGTKGSAGLPRSQWVKSLGGQDQLVRYFKPKQKALWMSQKEHDALPESILVREVRRTVRRKGLGKITVTLVTTLTDPALYPADELVKLRLERWEVETNLRYLKTTMGLDVLKCKSEAGVRKELCIFTLAYNLVRVVMLEAARRQGVPAKRISFSNALKWMRHARPGDALPKLVVNPHRPNRLEPRCKKRRPKAYDLMRKSRRIMQESLRNKARNA